MLCYPRYLGFSFRSNKHLYYVLLFWQDGNFIKLTFGKGQRGTLKVRWVSHFQTNLLEININMNRKKDICLQEKALILATICLLPQTHY